MQPTFRDFPDLIQCSERVKIQYFCPVRSVKAFDKGILCRLARFNKFQCYTMLSRPLCQCQRYEFGSVIPIECIQFAFYSAIFYNL